MALAEVHSQSLRTRRHRHPIRHLRRRLEQRVARMLARLRAGDPEQIRRQPHTQWLLDNGHVLRSALQHIRSGIPEKYYHQLPTVAEATRARGRQTRVASLVFEFVACVELPIDLHRFERFCLAYQTATALTIGELWALPTMLRVALLEKICNAAEQASADFANDSAHAGAEQLTSIIAGCITSLRELSAFQWEPLIERISGVDSVLRKDPAKVYGRMDFQTRDGYRKIIERIARSGKLNELDVAHAAIQLATTAAKNKQHPREHHVGYFLIDSGIQSLARALRVRWWPARRILNIFKARSEAVYVASLLTGAAALCALLILWLHGAGTSFFGVLGVTLIAAIPALSLSTGIINSLVCQVRQPRGLPKLDFAGSLPSEYHTIVAVPAMLSNRRAIAETLHTLELNYLGNAELGLQFVLLTDFVDATSASATDDQDLLEYAKELIDRLNKRYPRKNGPTFVLLHRRRRWNEAEGMWMGWERKRGKLVEFNDLLRGAADTDYTVQHGKLRLASRIRFVITLDADTFIPAGAAARLIETLAHPLNSPVIDDRNGKITAGYSIIQPRIEINPSSGGVSTFARAYSGDVTLDLYTHAVSDVYQDLFARGIFAGKGIYDLDAFRASVHRRIPENRVLSHDLLEGLYGRAGLASDIVLLEDYPTSLLGHLKRLHRWIRGDWQLLPWLIGRMADADLRGFEPGLIGRWQLLDNLRRSLLAPAVTLLFAAGWLFLPVNPWLWTMIVTVAPGLGIIVRALSAFRLNTWRWGTARSSLRNIADTAGTELAHWIFALAFLPLETLVVLDAIIRTLYRLNVSDRRLLEWTTAAEAARKLASSGGQMEHWKRLWAGPVWAAFILVCISSLQPASVPAAGVILLLWALSPAIAFRTGRVRDRPQAPLSLEQRLYLRRIARRTWRFFQQHVGPDTHWLPPDNVQVEPAPQVAEQTSPTNIGFALLSAVAAYDLGYTGLRETVYNLYHSLHSVARLRKYRGHLYNWYSLEDRRPLTPRYVSTVDSGNLLAAFIVVRQSLIEFAHSEFSIAPAIDGIRDDLSLLREMLTNLDRDPAAGSSASLLKTLDSIKSDMDQIDRPDVLVERLVEHRIAVLNQALLENIADENLAWTSREIEELRTLIHSLSHRSESALSESRDFFGWSEGLEKLSAGADERLGNAIRELWAEPALSALPRRLERVDELLQNSRTSLSESDRQTHPLTEDVERIREQIDRALQNLRSIFDTINELVALVDKLIDETDFGFLYDRNRHLFHVGYRVESGELDNSYYDLLASEARLASFIAIAKGDVPPKHWMHLGRPLTSIGGLRVLLSWSATAFEYLMPALLMRTPRFGLLSQSCRGAIKQQRRFAREHGIPWGISESGYHHFDQHGRYQYQAFGIPRLGLKWDQGERLVISSYSSMLALPVAAAAVVRNARAIERLGGAGFFGFYEALDFGLADRRHRRQPKIVQSFMAHHQGMTLTAIANSLTGEAMVERFHRDSRIASAEYLLHEQLPRRAQTQALETFEAPLKQAQPAFAAVNSWTVSPSDSALTVLANQRLCSRVTAAGGGNLLWRGYAISRWLPHFDGSNSGSLIYVKDLDRSLLWSPSAESTDSVLEIICRPDSVEFRNKRHSLLIRQQILVAPFCDVEIRKLSITNDAAVPRRLLLCAYSEPVLASAESDSRHPAFSKLFIEHQCLDDRRALIFRRRPRNPEETVLLLAHKAVVQAGVSVDWSFETERKVFLGRNGDRVEPRALAGTRSALRCPAGMSLDPVSAVAIAVDVPAHQTVQCAFLSAAGNDEATVLRDIDRLDSLQQIDWVIDEARRHAEQELLHLGVTSEDVQRGFELFGASLMPPRPEPERVEQVSKVQQAQSRLWRHGISGDRPLITAVLAEPGHLPRIKSLVRALSVCQARGMTADIIFIDESDSGYTQPTQDRLRRLIDDSLQRTAGNHRFSTYILPAYSLAAGERSAISACSALYFDLRRGDWSDQLQRWRDQRSRVPPFLPQPSAPIRRLPIESVDRPPNLLCDTGLSGLSPAGDEYIICLDKDVHTPAPWCNVLANPEFGTLISESGSAFTWYRNSSEFALTPWNNDAVLDRPGEALYLRDEETGLFWSPLPGPARDDQTYVVTHAIGSSRFDHHSEGLEQRVTVLIDPAEPVKYVHLRLKNRWPRTRRLTITYAAEWRLGDIGRGAGLHLFPGWDRDENILYARNAFSPGNAEVCAFLTSNLPAHGVTCDGLEFLGPTRSWRAPASLRSIGLTHDIGPCAFPMAVYQVHVSLSEGEACELHFALGAERNRARAFALAGRSRQQTRVAEVRTTQQQAWRSLLGTCSVRTGDATLNALLNYWLPYQIVSSRLFGRVGFYQASGGIGFRDQLQDVLALLNSRPELAAAHIKQAASAQFEEGDVLHWWHSEPMRGVRTRCSDDLLWLPYAVSQYVDVTGDHSILDYEVPFLRAPPLSDDEIERYAEYRPGDDIGSLYEHCCRAIECRMRLGRHGLPLIGSGDWNDGFSRVGIRGAGESVWLAWFLIDVCRRFEVFCSQRNDALRGGAFRQLRETLMKNVEAHAWAGEWYLRGFYDDGATLGGPDDAECKIDLNAQTWAVLVGGNRERQKVAMKAVREKLIDGEHRLIKLLTPPFHGSDREPGYIKAYPPGVRENGGQYNHAAAWAILAAVVSGDADLAHEWLRFLNPLLRSGSREDCERYAIEPYVMAGDVYSSSPLTGRGGWSWYTGSAAWYYRVAIENLLGIQRRGNRLQICPCLPDTWGDFEISLQIEEARYRLEIHEPSRIRNDQILFVSDGEILPGTSLTLESHGVHRVQVFPDEASWQRWRSAGSEATTAAVQEDT